MRTYEVTEVEKEDWDMLPNMSDERALEILKHKDIEDYCGGFLWGSTNIYDYQKAEFLYAFEVAIRSLRKEVNEQT